ncbi:MAG: ATP synthase subunit C [Spirochaetaceae bacterium]|jgi:V/A-type H+-transporting ATPase subunit K|nr:ATP synthase subunit C [Spirochaetaceae bacterium]
MKRIVLVVFLFLCLAPGVLLFAQETAGEGQPAAGETAVWKYFAAALAVGISCIAGGIAVGQIGAAAMGAMSENPELSGKALPYAGLAEGICLWGFLVALLILIF